MISSYYHVLAKSLTHLEELPEPFRIKGTQSTQIFINNTVFHTHASQLDISQPGKVFLTCFGVDGLLQACRFSQGLPTLCVLRIKVGIAGDGPAQRRKTCHHKLVEAGERGL